MSVTGVNDTTYAGAATTAHKAGNSVSTTAFAALLAQAGQVEETSPVLTREEEAELREKQRIRELMNSILTDTDSPCAGKSVDELKEGLDHEYAELGQDIAYLADKYGIDSVHVLTCGILIRIPSPIDSSKFFVQSRITGETTLNGSGYQAEIDRLKDQGVWDKMLADCFQQVEDFFTEYRESQRNWNATRDKLATRSAVIKAAKSIPGFEKEYAADPTAAIDKYFDTLKDEFTNVKISYSEGQTSWNG